MKNLVFQIGGTEWLWVIIVLVVMLFGAGKIPEIAKSIGRATGEFQKGKMEIEREIAQATKELEKTPERLRLEEAARVFGIDPTGKTDEQLREEIKKST
ncbi:MAG: twin-arginine translocase TatA/TatE family subunit [Nitrososphaeria archaeon]